MQTSEVLNTAADLIEERGWGTGVNSWGQRTDLCIEGAIGAALGLGIANTTAINTCPAGRAVREYLDLPVASDETSYLSLLATSRSLPGIGLWVFNDAPNRTATEVIEVLRAAALIEAAKERADVAEVVAS